MVSMKSFRTGGKFQEVSEQTDSTLMIAMRYPELKFAPDFKPKYETDEFYADEPIVYHFSCAQLTNLKAFPIDVTTLRSCRSPKLK